MNWVSRFLTSSLGQKLIMSLSGLFLSLFLVVHLIGNLQLLKSDGGIAFNWYTYFMTHNPVIILISYTLYITILLHAIQGIILYVNNRKAKGQKYAVSSKIPINPSSKYMAHLGILIFVFLIVHLYQFWLQMKLGNLNTVTIPGMDHPVMDLYTPVMETYRNILFVAFYVISMIFVGLHLDHGFQSAFQSLGLNHKKYTPIIKFIGKWFAILLSAGFALIPIYLYFN